MTRSFLWRREVTAPTDSESNTESLAGGVPDKKRQRRRLKLNWADKQEQEIQDSHDERLARCSVTLLLRDNMCLSVPAQPQLWRWAQTNLMATTSRNSCRPWFRGERRAEETRAALMNKCFRNLDCVELVNVFEVRPLVKSCLNPNRG